MEITQEQDFEPETDNNDKQEEKESKDEVDKFNIWSNHSRYMARKPLSFLFDPSNNHNSYILDILVPPPELV